MTLLRRFVDAGVRVMAYDVHLIQIPTSVNRRENKLEWLARELRAAGVELTSPPTARKSKDIPSDGFAIPAALCLSAPGVVCRSLGEHCGVCAVNACTVLSSPKLDYSLCTLRSVRF